MSFHWKRKAKPKLFLSFFYSSSGTNILFNPAVTCILADWYTLLPIYFFLKEYCHTSYYDYACTGPPLSRLSSTLVQFLDENSLVPVALTAETACKIYLFRSYACLRRCPKTGLIPGNPGWQVSHIPLPPQPFGVFGRERNRQFLAWNKSYLYALITEITFLRKEVTLGKGRY